MKRLNLIGLFITPLMAGTLINAAELKIGVVDVHSVLEQSPQKVQALSRLGKEFLSRSKSLDKKHKDIITAQNNLAKDSIILSTDTRKERERNIVTDQRELQRLQDEFREDLSIRKDEELQKLNITIVETIANLAQAESYDLVVHQGVILYASEHVNMTAKVLELMRAKPK